MKTKVAIVKCPDYQQANVDHAIRQGLELLGGLGQFVHPGEKVLLKVNALMDVPPDAAVTTHPSLVEALGKELKALRAFPLVGDSPGNAAANNEKTMEIDGYTRAIKNAGGEVLNFQKFPIVDIPSPSGNRRINKIKISQAVLDVDTVINLPKLKTHGWMLFSGAIKNLYGVVPGFYKSKFHIVSPQPDLFSETLVDIFQIVKPRLNIMDAVIGMEGAGPSAGEKRFMGALFFSTDAVALDAVCSAAIGYRPLTIDTTRIACERGLGTAKLEEIEIVGTTLEEVAQPNWKHSASRRG